MNGMSGWLIWLIVLIVVVAAVVIIVVVRGQARQRSKKPAPPVDPFHTGDQDSLRGDPRKLKAGDIVELRGDSYTVRGSLRLSEGGWTWTEHLLDDAKGTQLWLSVEEDPDLLLALWTPTPESDLEPGPSTITWHGRHYRSDESGSAHYTSEATTGLGDAGTVRYHDYEAPDGSLLSFEAFGDAGWELSVGDEISRYDLRVYPVSE